MLSTRTERIHFACTCGVRFAADIVRSVSTADDPQRSQALRAGQLNVVACQACGTRHVAEAPVVYHDPSIALVVLVLPEAYRWRELEERRAVYDGLCAERGDVPAYALSFGVVYGFEGLEAELTARAEEEARAASASLDATALAQREADIARREEEIEARAQELDRVAQEMDARQSAPAPSVQLAPASDPDATPLPEPMVDTTGPFEQLDEADLEPVAEESTRVSEGVSREVTLERWIVSRKPTHHVIENGTVRLLAALPADRLEPLLTGEIDVAIQLHRLPSYPIVVLSVSAFSGPPGAAAFVFDVGRREDKVILQALAQAFRFHLDLHDHEYLPVLQRDLEAPLKENARFILSAAAEHLESIEPASRSFDRALQGWNHRTFDRWGRRAHKLEKDSFTLLPTPGATRLALMEVAHWSEPANEDYLILIKSFPLAWWQKIRSRVVARAVEYGLALTPVLSQLAISEGLARSRKDLAKKLVDAFCDVAVGVKSNDLDPEAVKQNWGALLAECESLGIAVDQKAQDLIAVAMAEASERPRRGRNDERRSSVVGGQNGTGDPDEVIAGEIAGGSKAGKPNFATASTEQLLELLDDKHLRRDVAVELCRRGDPAAVGPVFGALRRMTRGEAVKVLPVVVSFGDRAVPHLLDGLRSKKAFLRHGCALALSVLKSAEGIEPLCDALLLEPTDVWREIARAVGEVGAGAVMSLAARLKENSEDPERRERVAWALAHVVSQGIRGPVETLAGGRDRAAADVARKALALADTVRRNDSEVRGESAPRDQTVNRAFSRRFFAALAGKEGAESDEDIEELPIDDAEVLYEEEEVLDEEDLIPTG